MSNHRLVRARKTQRIFAEHVRWLWPFASSRGGSEPGPDIENTPGIDFELKATRDNPLLKAMKQLRKRSNGALGVVVWRPDGYGEERVDDWIMAVRVADGLKLLQEAGYGTPGEVPLDKGD